jgi:hypothetical protein
MRVWQAALGRFRLQGCGRVIFGDKLPALLQAKLTNMNPFGIRTGYHPDAIALGLAAESAYWCCFIFIVWHIKNFFSKER